MEGNHRVSQINKEEVSGLYVSLAYFFQTLRVCSFQTCCVG